MPTWLEQIPLPLWAITLIATIVLAAVVFALRRWFRLKAVKLNMAVTTLEFERKNATATAPPPAPAASISQEAIAEAGASMQDVKQNAEGSNIQQKVQSKGQMTGVTQNAKNR